MIGLHPKISFFPLLGSIRSDLKRTPYSGSETRSCDHWQDGCAQKLFSRGEFRAEGAEGQRCLDYYRGAGCIVG